MIQPSGTGSLRATASAILPAAAAEVEEVLVPHGLHVLEPRPEVFVRHLAEAHDPDGGAGDRPVLQVEYPPRDRFALPNQSQHGQAAGAVEGRWPGDPRRGANRRRPCPTTAARIGDPPTAAGW